MKTELVLGLGVLVLVLVLVLDLENPFGVTVSLDPDTERHCWIQRRRSPEP